MRCAAEQAVSVLHEPGGATTVREVCRRHAITETTSFRWRTKFLGMQTAEIRRLNQLEDKNRRSNQLVPVLNLDHVRLKDVAGRSW